MKYPIAFFAPLALVSCGAVSEFFEPEVRSSEVVELVERVADRSREMAPRADPPWPEAEVESIAAASVALFQENETVPPGEAREVLEPLCFMHDALMNSLPPDDQLVPLAPIYLGETWALRFAVGIEMPAEPEQ